MMARWTVGDRACSPGVGMVRRWHGLRRAASCHRPVSSSTSGAKPLPWKPARFAGANIAVAGPVDSSFEARLQRTMDELVAAERRGVWMSVPIEHAAAASVARRHGFSYHHADGDTAVLLRWLRDEEPNPVPAFGTHIVGVGGLVINERRQVLCVREAIGPDDTGPGSWKLPGGLMNLGEEIGEAAVREVKEETGIDCEFESVLTMRSQHGAAFDRDDLYFICAMTPKTEDIKVDSREIAQCEWLSLDKYLRSTLDLVAARGGGDSLNSLLMRNVVASLRDSGQIPAEWGWREKLLNSASSKSNNHATSGKRDADYRIYIPRSFLPRNEEAPLPVSSTLASNQDLRRSPVQGVRGMRDMFPPESRRMAHLRMHAIKSAELAGYEPVSTPLLEQVGVFTHALGGESDVVNKVRWPVINLRPVNIANLTRFLSL